MPSNYEIVTTKDVAFLRATSSGNTVLVNAPGSDLSIRVFGYIIESRATTLNQVIGLNQGTTTRIEHVITSAGNVQTYSSPSPFWVLPANTSLNVNLATTGSFVVVVPYDVIRRV